MASLPLVDVDVGSMFGNHLSQLSSPAYLQREDCSPMVTVPKEGQLNLSPRSDI